MGAKHSACTGVPVLLSATVFDYYPAKPYEIRDGLKEASKDNKEKRGKEGRKRRETEEEDRMLFRYALA